MAGAAKRGHNRGRHRGRPRRSIWWHRMTEKERVIFAYPDAFCVSERGLYQILRPCIQTSGSPFANEYLSAQHLTEDLAWHFAAVRVRLKDRAMARIETNRALVLETYPKAWCAHLRGDY